MNLRRTAGRRRKPAEDRRGVSLLEVVLALALASVFMIALVSVIHLQTRAISRGRTEVEQAQLARTLLHRIADDLRSTLAHRAVDVSGVKEFLENATNIDAAAVLGSDAAAALSSTSGSSASGTQSAGGQSGQGGGQSGSGQGGGPGGGQTGGQGGGGGQQGGSSQSGGQGGGQGGGGSAATGTAGAASTGSSGGSSGAATPTSGSGVEAAAANAESATALADDLAPSEVPGLYGQQTTLQLDVSRLPRTDQLFLSSQAGGGLGGQASTPVDRPSDVKTVAYFVIPESSTAGSRAGGLYRRELDRAATQFAASQGSVAGLDASAEPMAPEVVGLEFRYYDGSGWTTSWDSTASEGPPTAVQIAITLRRYVPPPLFSGGLFGGGAQPVPEDTMYQMTAYIPNAASQGVSGDPASAVGDAATDDASAGSTGAAGATQSNAATTTSAAAAATTQGR